MLRTYGIERERFMVDKNGKVVPVIGEMLPEVHRIALENEVCTDRFTYELFAGQIEDRSPPTGNCRALKECLMINDRVLSLAAERVGVDFLFRDALDQGDVSSLEVNPFDTRHREEVWKNLTLAQKWEASSVAAVHVHVKVSQDEVVPLLNFCRCEIVDQLIELGDHSSGKRITAYQKVSQSSGVPPTFTHFAEVLAYIEARGGEKNVWDLVRYKPSTETMEFRMFGTTGDVEEIMVYVAACRRVVKSSS